jgi:hypothetical protein
MFLEIKLQAYIDKKAKEYCMIVLQFENNINKSKIDFISSFFVVCKCQPWEVNLAS